MQSLKIIFVLTLLSQMGWAQNSTTSTSDSPGFKVDDSNYKEIFNRSIADIETKGNQSPSKNTILMGMSYFQPKALTIKNDYFDIDYSGASGLPIVQLGIASDMWILDQSTIGSNFTIGYGFHEEQIAVRSSKGIFLKDNIAMQIIPISAGLEWKRYLTADRGVSFRFAPQIGSTYVDQQGQLDGSSKTVWITNWSARAGFGFFEKNQSQSFGFQGFTFTSTYTDSLESDQKFQGTSFDLNLLMTL